MQASRARAQGKKLGRPQRIDSKVEDKIRKLRAAGAGQLKIAKQLHIGVGRVQRVLSAEASA